MVILTGRIFLPTLSSFDFANPNIHAPQRVETTVPQQALFAFNHPFVIERSATLAKKAFDSKTANSDRSFSIDR